MMNDFDREKIKAEIEEDLKEGDKKDNLYGPSEPYLFIFLGVLTFLVLFFVFQYFATINDGIEENFNYIFCNNNTDNSGATNTDVSNSANFSS
jgi:hypothetical protein